MISKIAGGVGYGSSASMIEQRVGKDQGNGSVVSVKRSGNQSGNEKVSLRMRTALYNERLNKN